MNNPTIDGVSRITHQKVLKAYDYANEHPHKYLRGTSNWCAAVAHKLNELLDAPVVERQPAAEVQHGPCDDVGAPQWVRVATLGEFELENFPDGTKFYTAPPEVAALQSIIAQLEDKLNKAIDLDFQRRETIEQLQARIAELESGRGAPVAYRHTMHFGENFGSQSKFSLSSEDGFGKSGIDYDEIFKVTCEPLFTAPPAQIEVVLPEHIDSDLRSPVHGYARGWNACLDATAALNGVPK